ARPQETSTGHIADAYERRPQLFDQSLSAAEDCRDDEHGPLLAGPQDNSPLLASRLRSLGRFRKSEQRTEPSDSEGMPVVPEQVAPFDRFDVVTGNADNPLNRFRGHEEELPTCLDQQTVKGRNRGGEEHTYHRPCPSARLQVDLAPQTLDPLLDDGQPQA